MNKTDLETGKEVKFLLRQLAFAPIGRIIATKTAAELKVKGKLSIPEQDYIELTTQNLIQQIDRECAKREIQFDLASSLLKQALHLLPASRRLEIEEQLDHAMEKLAALITFYHTDYHTENTHTEKAMNGPSENSFQSMFGLSDDMLLWIYSVGYQFSSEKKYEEALTIFQLLTTLNPLIVDYLIAQGITQRNLQKNEEALWSFAMASTLNPHQPLARIHSTELYLELQKRQDARLEFEVLEEIILAGGQDHLKPAMESLRSRII